MKITNGVINRDEAVRLAPDYVAWLENHKDNPLYWDKISAAFDKLKVGQKVVTFMGGIYVLAKVSSSKMPHWEADGPVVRVSNGEYSWRVDGDRYAYPLSTPASTRWKD
jgi:hypothetical protein